MPIQVYLRFILVLGLSASYASPSNHTAEVEGYFFLSADLIVFHEDTPSVASKVTEVNIYILKGVQELAVSRDTRIGLKMTPVVTEAFLKLEDFDYVLSNRAVGRKEVGMLSELSYSHSMSEGEVGDIRSINPNVDDQTLLSQEEAFRDQMGREIDDLRMLEEGWVDSVSLKFTVTASQDLQAVYVVCGLSYSEKRESSENERDGSRMVVHYLGDLKEGESIPFQCLRHLERFQAVESDCELFFFQGNAEPVAHTLARKLRPLNKEETAQVRAYLSQRLNN